jgi:hypothetical protein
MINWGDGNTTDWLGPYESGEEIIVSHAWKTVGKYTILVKAKNIYGEESYSDPFIIQIIELKKTILLGIFHNQSETDDLRILDMNFLCIVPSNSIMYSNVQLVVRQEHRGGFVFRSFIGGIFEAILIF